MTAAIETHCPDNSSQPFRAQALFQRHLRELAASTDRRFAVLVGIEWLAAAVVALWISPFTWNGDSRAVHPHIWLALGLGGVIASLPVALALWQTSGLITRHINAASQMLMAGLLVHLTGGRIETHFALFGMLAFLSFYRDWAVLLTATGVTVMDHLMRALMWPASMYGVAVVSFWRPLEHAGWVVFEVVLLIDFIRQDRRSIFAAMEAQARAERESDRLRSSEVRYRIIFEETPIPMWLCDAKTLMFLAVNRAAVEKYGYSQEEFLKMHAYQIQLLEDWKQFRQHLENVSDGSTLSLRWRHKKKVGTVFDVEMVAHQMTRDGRKVLLLLATDISARTTAERERDSMEVLLRHAQKMESIGQLAAGIAHEINTPAQYVGDNLHFLLDSFTQIQSLIELETSLIPRLEANGIMQGSAGEIREALEEADAPYLMGEILKALEQAIDGVGRIATLVQAMKEFSHPGQKEKTLSSLNRAIESTVTVARNEWKYVADVVLDLDPLLPPIPCLVNDFNQVILNLIVNAAHAIKDVVHDSGTKGTITIRSRQEGEWAEVRIEDTGTGIPEAVRERIFDPFFTTKRVGSGSGQGLAIARSVIVERHGGTIDFETQTGRGTVFVIRLPLVEAAANPALAESEKALAG